MAEGEQMSVNSEFKPYYQDGLTTIYHGDCREILPMLALEPDLVVTDPPYGVKERTERGKAGRGRSKYALGPARNFAPVHGDDEAYDPTPILGFKRLITFGANHYADKMPPSPSWIVWDKLDGLRSKRGFGFNDNGDAEMAWSNLGGPVRIVSHRWMGLTRDSEKERHVHPTQKPVYLFSVLIGHYTEVGHLVLDPYMGSGPVLVAAKALGRRAIGIEIEEKYCEVTANRLAQETLWGAA